MSHNRREDGRRLHQLRNISFTIGIDPTVNGSCHIHQGLTEVICLIHGPRARTQQNDVVLIEYSVSPFSSIESKRNSKFDKEYSMFAENLRSSIENLIILDPNSKSEIQISVCVIQNDGSSKSAIFNAVTLALLDAGIPMKDFLVSTTVGLIGGQNVIDLTNEESKQCQAEITLSFQQRKQRIDYFELKTLKINEGEVESLTKLGIQGAEDVYKWMRQQILDLKK